MFLNQIKANHWYGSSRYPVHEAQGEELAKVVDTPVKELTKEIVKLMTKWNGGHPITAEMVTFSIIGDGWDFSFQSGDPQWYMTDAMREAAADERALKEVK